MYNRNALLGPSGQNDLVHYETRLKEGLEDETYSIAMEILAEAATLDVFTRGARGSLERLYANVVGDAPGAYCGRARRPSCTTAYIEAGPDGHRFPSRLLKDWWSARFRDHHVPLERRRANDGLGGPA